MPSGQRWQSAQGRLSRFLDAKEGVLSNQHLPGLWSLKINYVLTLSQIFKTEEYTVFKATVHLNGSPVVVTSRYMPDET